MEQALLKYLSHVGKLEAEVYTQEQIISKLTNQANHLGQGRKIDSPTPVAVGTNATRKGATIGMAMGLLPVCVYYILQIDRAGFWDAIWIFIKMIFFGVLFGVILMVIGMQIGKKKDQKLARKMNTENLMDVVLLKEQDKNRVQRELGIQKQIHAQIQQVKQQQAHATQVLGQFYDMDIVHPKYRSLVPIVTFCEYFETGRCTQLTGHEGAYNIYEQEVRLDKIATKMDVIIQKLDDIKAIQYDLYQVVSATNHTISKVVAENERMITILSDISENAALTAYNTHANMVMTSAIADMMVIRELFNSNR